MSTPERSVSETGIGIEVLNRQRLIKIDPDATAKLARAVLDRIGRPEAAMTITFIRDRRMRRLNRDYRGIDRPTDVLSFAYQDGEDNIFQTDEAAELGDVVISVETAQRYAEDHGLSFEREVCNLVIHGTLHLAGYDHETDNGEMSQLEKRLRKELLRGIC